jgi:antitoxin component of RelBE/YafQ-DinJ toxin-antitoxin module
LYEQPLNIAGGQTMAVQIMTEIDETISQQFSARCKAIGIEPDKAIVTFIHGMATFNPSAETSQPQKQKNNFRSAIGAMKDHFDIADDFNAPLEDLHEYM